MIDKSILDDFDVPSVIWGIDGDWMVNTIPVDTPFFPTDHCGVLRIKAPVLFPTYLAWLLYKEGKRLGFRRSYRASIDRIESISVMVAPMADQLQTQRLIEKEEAKMLAARKAIAIHNEECRNILAKWLL